MKEDLETIVEYAGLEGDELYDDFESIVNDVLEAKEAERSFTSSQLPEGFDSETLDGSDFGFYAEKSYDTGVIEVEYSESSSISFGSKDSSRISVEVDPAGYSFREAWDQER